MCDDVLGVLIVLEHILLLLSDDLFIYIGCISLHTIVQTLLVRAECVRCPWLQAETKVATILGILVRAALCRRCLTAVGHYFR